jgi:putative membrane protein
LIRGWSVDVALLFACAAALLGFLLATDERRSKRTLAFTSALAVVLLCRQSPLELLAANGLFSAHMVEHIMFVLIVPLLLVRALPRGTTSSALAPPAVASPSTHALPATAPSAARALRALSARPLVAWLCGVGAMWIWHVPALHAATHTRPWLENVELVSLLGLGFAFWLPVAGPSWVRRLDPLLTILYLFTACVGCSLLGILVTFAPAGLYASHAATAAGDPAVRALVAERWGISTRMDQQLGGLLMWVPCCLIYVSGSMVALARWYAAPPSAEELPASQAPTLGSAAGTVKS